MRKLIRLLVQTKLTWGILNLFYRIFNRFKFEKELIEIEKQRAELVHKENKLKQIYADLTVKSGIFTGMRYPGFIAHGSAMFPKLAGSYEAELTPALEELLKNDYKRIIDIGCAEGYYAVGLAMKKSQAQVHAYDINNQALAECKKMAEINGVINRMHFEGYCTPDALASMDLTERAFILCDCEGYELELFNQKAVANLKNCDILIELHDLYNEKISPAIESIFKTTHNVKMIYSQNTFKKMEALNLAKEFSEDEIKTFFF